MAEYRAICPAEELPSGAARLVEIDERLIALFNIDGALYAMEDTCLHAGGPLHEGAVEGTIVTCPWHDWQFDVTDGTCNLNPKVSLDTFEVRVVDGTIEIAV